jgi:ribosomal protein S18 acetylase RimI-like enzyme
VQFVFKRAAASDIESLLTLMNEFYAEAGFALNRASTSAALQSLLSSPSLGCVWLAQLDDVPVGHTVLTVRFTMEHEGLSGYIDDLYVEPRYRRLGVGRGLLCELVAECHLRGCKSLQVEVGQENAAALSLYGRLGLHATRDGRVLASGPLPGAGA